LESVILAETGELGEPGKNKSGDHQNSPFEFGDTNRGLTRSRPACSLNSLPGIVGIAEQLILGRSQWQVSVKCFVQFGYSGDCL
jgi:hypothetical protein